MQVLNATERLNLIRWLYEFERVLLHHSYMAGSYDMDTEPLDDLCMKYADIVKDLKKLKKIMLSNKVLRTKSVIFVKKVLADVEEVIIDIEPVNATESSDKRIQIGCKVFNAFLDDSKQGIEKLLRLGKKRLTASVDPEAV